MQTRSYYGRLVKRLDTALTPAAQLSVHEVHPVLNTMGSCWRSCMKAHSSSLTVASPRAGPGHPAQGHAHLLEPCAGFPLNVHVVLLTSHLYNIEAFRLRQSGGTPDMDLLFSDVSAVGEQGAKGRPRQRCVPLHAEQAAQDEGVSRSSAAGGWCIGISKLGTRGRLDATCHTAEHTT